MSTPREEGWTGVDVDGAGIDMYPAPAQKMMGDIADVLTAARETWTRSNAKMLGLESKLGEGPMGEPMREQYNPAAKQLREFIAEMVQRLARLSDAGTKAVPIYVNQDQAAGQHFEF